MQVWEMTEPACTADRLAPPIRTPPSCRACSTSHSVSNVIWSWPSCRTAGLPSLGGVGISARRRSSPLGSGRPTTNPTCAGGRFVVKFGAMRHCSHIKSYRASQTSRRGSYLCLQAQPYATLGVLPHRIVGSHRSTHGHTRPTEQLITNRKAPRGVVALARAPGFQLLILMAGLRQARSGFCDLISRFHAGRKPTRGLSDPDGCSCLAGNVMRPEPVANHSLGFYKRI